MSFLREGSEILPLQDLDLFTRLSHYFDSFEQQLRAGHGWLIFNSSGARAARISAFIARRISEFGPWISSYLVPWREFSLNAYMVEVGLQSVGQPETLEGKAKAEFDIATRVSRDAMVKMVASDLLVVTGVRPSHSHELEFLNETIERRYNQHLSTILVTPQLPQEMPLTFESVAPGLKMWDRLYARMYERCFIAL